MDNKIQKHKTVIIALTERLLVLAGNKQDDERKGRATTRKERPKFQ